MNKFLLIFLKRIYALVNLEVSVFGRHWKIFPAKEYAANLIRDALLSPKLIIMAKLESI